MRCRYPIDALVTAAQLQAVNFRGLYERRCELAEAKPRPKWNPDLLPGDARTADERDGLALFMEWVQGAPEAAMTRDAWQRLVESAP